MADDEIEVGVGLDVDTKSFVTDIDKATSHLKALLETAQGIGSAFKDITNQSAALSNLVKSIEPIQAAIISKENEIAELRRKKKSTRESLEELANLQGILADRGIGIEQGKSKLSSIQAAYTQKQILGAPAPGGGTLADAKLINYGINSYITALNSTPDQVYARAADASAKAAEKLLNTTTSALRARFVKASINTDNLISTYDDPSMISAIINKNNFQRNQTQKRYSSEGILQQELKELLEPSKRSLSFKVNSEALENKQFLEYLKPISTQIRMLTNSELVENRRVAKGEKEKRKEEDSFWAEQRRNLSIRANSEALENKGKSKEAAKEYRSSPAGIAEGFENRIRIFSDYATIGGAVLGIRSLLASVTQLDDGLKQFQAITQTTDSELVKFKESLLDIGSSSRFSLKDLTELSTVLGQTGLSAADVVKTLPSVIDLATASGATIKQTTDVFTTAFGAFQMQASQSQDIANTIAEALNSTKLSVEQLSQGLSYAANVAAESGVSFNELTAVLAGLSQAGIKSGSTAGTGVRQFIQELNAPTEKLINVMNQLGITTQDISIKTNGFIGVLENLKEKGFGSSEALRSLDLRAASMFTALVSRLDRVKAVQEQMALSNAATEGAAKASESLNATWTRVANTAQALAAKGLAPLIEALTKLGGVLADIGKSAEGLGGLLPILGTAGVSVAGGFGASWLLQMGRGIAQLAINFKQAETAAVSFGTVLTAMTRANPILMALGIGAGIAASSYFGGKNELAKRIEEGKEALNGLQSRQAQTEASIASIDKSISNLIDKREKLNNDGIARREMILQAQKDFRQLGLDIDVNSSSIDVLIKALQNLRGELQNALPTNFALQLSNIAKAIKDNMVVANEADAGSSKRILGENGLYGYRFGSREAADDRLNKFVQSRFQNRLDPVLQFVQSNTSSLNYNDAAKAGNRMFGDLNKLQAEIANKIDAGDKNPELVKDLQVIASLLAEVTKKMGQLNNQQGLEIQRRQLEKDYNVSNVERTSQFGEMKNTIDKFNQDIKIGLSQILDDPLIKTDYPARRKKLMELNTDISSKASGYEKQINAVQEELAKKYGMEVVKIAFQPLFDELENLKKGTTGPQIDIQKMAAADSAKVNQLSLREVEAEKKVLNSKIRLASTTEEIDTISQKLADLTKKEFQIKEEDVRVKSRLINQPTETVNEEIDKLKETLADSIEKIEVDMSAKRKEIIIKMVEMRMSSLKEEEDALTAKYKNTLAKLNLAEKSDVEKIGGLETTLKELSAAIRGNADQQAITAATRDRLQTSGFEFNSVESKISNAASANGGAQFTRYLLGLAQAESTMNPNAKNGNATGLFQFMPKTWKDTGGGDIYDIATQVRNVLKLMQEDFIAFRAKFNRAPDDNELYLMHQQGQKAALALLDPSNSNKTAADVIQQVGGNRKAVFNSGNKDADILAKDFVNLVERYFDKNYAKTDVIGDRNIVIRKKAALSEAKEKQNTADTAIDAREGYVYPGMYNGLGSSIMAGSNSFFRSSGMLNAEREFKSFNEIIADSWGQTLGSMNNSMSQFFLNWANGTMKGKDAFLGFTQAIITSMMQIATQVAASQVLRMLFGGQMLGTGGGDALTGGILGTAIRSITGAASSVVGGAGPLAVPTFSTGGPVYHYADGGATANRDSVPAMLMPGEFVLRRSAVDAIGRDRLDEINAMGMTTVSKSEDQTPTISQPTQPAVTNVWVVSPDQVPPPSERDIIVTVARDIQNRGSIRQLIQSVAAGG